MTDSLLDGHGLFQRRYFHEARVPPPARPRRPAPQRPLHRLLGLPRGARVPDQRGLRKLFVLRNIGNFVPTLDHSDASVGAAVDYAVGTLEVPDIIVWPLRLRRREGRARRPRAPARRPPLAARVAGGRRPGRPPRAQRRRRPRGRLAPRRRGERHPGPREPHHLRHRASEAGVRRGAPPRLDLRPLPDPHPRARRRAGGLHRRQRG